MSEMKPPLSAEAIKQAIQELARMHAPGRVPITVQGWIDILPPPPPGFKWVERDGHYLLEPSAFAAPVAEMHISVAEVRICPQKLVAILRDGTGANITIHPLPDRQPFGEYWEIPQVVTSGKMYSDCF